MGLVGFSFAAVASAVGVWGVGFLRTGPPPVAAKVVRTASGCNAYLTIQTVGSIGYGPRPSWVSYLVQNTKGQWVHSTIFVLPSHCTIHMTNYEYDGVTPLRNNVFGRVTGTVGGKEYVTGDVGSKKYSTSTPVSVVDGATVPAHTFTVPALGINVPWAATTASNLCAVAPCSPKSPHDIDKITFKTGAAGYYRWQCIVPCGLNFLDGNGGPMQTMGYMQGFLAVEQS